MPITVEDEKRNEDLWEAVHEAHKKGLAITFKLRCIVKVPPNITALSGKSITGKVCSISDTMFKIVSEDHTIQTIGFSNSLNGWHLGLDVISFEVQKENEENTHANT